MNYEFKCPYCFNKVAHTDVAFRAETIFASEEFDCTGKGRTREDITMLYVGEDRPENKQILDEYDRRKQFSLSEDPIYNCWWSNFGATTEFPGDKCFAEYNRPIITPKKFGASEIIFDDDGFAVAVRDPWGKETLERVCPHCHNPLLQGYGKYPVRNICVVGGTGVGKTVYLSQLLKQLTIYLGNWGLTGIPSKNLIRFIDHNIISEGNPLPAATYPLRFEQPLFVNVNSGKGKNETLVFYSVAGEDCLNLSHSHYEHIIRNADGIILLIDPNELLSNRFMTEEILRNFILAKSSNNSIDIPIAVCVSKSDIIEEIIPEICFEDVKSNNFVFCSEDYNIISQALSELFEKNYPILNTILSLYADKYNFFAISSLGKGCKIVSDNRYVGKLSSEPNPTRIEEPLGWLLKEFDIIKSDGDIFTPKNKRVISDRNEILKEITQLQAKLENYPKICFGEKLKQKKDLLAGINDLQEKTAELDQKIEKYAQ